MMGLTLDRIEPWRKRKAAYQTAFRGAHATDLLADLAKFCHAFEPCAVAGNADLTLLNEGKRLVWLRIHKMLNFTPEELAVHFDAYMQLRD